MKERFLSFTGQQYTPVTFGTFHGCVLWNIETGIWIYCG